MAELIQVRLPAEARRTVRLLPRTRAPDVERGLQARTKDPLWYLARQWQMGEFAARNGGHPVRATVEHRTVPVDGVVGAPAAPLPRADAPVEAALPEAAWKADRLEYAFEVGVGATRLRCPEHHAGSLDWYDFDAPALAAPAGAPERADVVPQRASFKGMAAQRFWQFEDARVNLADLRRPDLDVVSMLMAEFSLLFTGDWFVLPLAQRAGSLRTVDRLTVVDTFGTVERIPPTVDASAGQRGWSLFSLAGDAGTSTSARFLLWSAVAHSLTGEPLEEVTFARDEGANLVWAVEHRVLDGDAVVNRDDEEAAAARPLPTPADLPLYRLATPVPRNWIPFVSRRLARDGATVFRRARTDAAATAAAPQHRGRFLAESRVVREEEVLAVPLRLSRRWVAATAGGDRWSLVRRGATWTLARRDQKALFTWLARDKRVAPRQPPSSLRFDQVVER